jgi:polyhydroxybutyrate depolymerase
MSAVPLAVLLAALHADPLTPGNHTRTVEVAGRKRTYQVHVPRSYDAKKPAPVVLIFHGAGTNGPIMSLFCGLDAKADAAGFLAVYPNGTGPNDTTLYWNAGDLRRFRSQADDVAFVAALLDDLARAANVDTRRVYATGMSTGGMMAYRLAAELSDRIAAIAPVGGTLALAKCSPKRPVPVLHFHGTADRFVPFDGPDPKTK